MDKEKQAYEWFSSISPVKVDWLWYPYIPCGKISILQGDPGCGKSMMIIDIISRLTTGRTLPDGRKIEPINVIYQCSEDGLQDTIKPRLERAGANCDRVAYINEDVAALTLDDVMSYEMPHDFMNGRHINFRIYSLSFVQDLLRTHGLNSDASYILEGKLSYRIKGIYFPLNTAKLLSDDGGGSILESSD